MTRKKKAKLLLYSLWFAGLGVLFFLWEFQKTIPGQTGNLLAVIIQGAGYFYPLSFFPYKFFVEETIGD